MLPPRLLVVLPLLCAPLVACGPSSATAPDLLGHTTTGAAFESESCSAFRPPTEPDLMGWDSGSRANLKSMREQGVVAVRYKAEGCNVELEVLNCTGEGEYEFSAYPSSDTKVSKSARDLYADLPIGAARLGTKVGGGRALRTDYMMTGLYRVSSYDAYPAGLLKGSGCDQATHVVAKMYVGGFGMTSGATESLQGSASVFGIGAAASQDRGSERVAVEGNPEACQRAQKDGKADPLCNVPLRVGLIPVDKTGATEKIERPTSPPTLNETASSPQTPVSASPPSTPKGPLGSPGSAEARCRAGHASACTDWGVALRDGMGLDGKGVVPDPPASVAYFRKGCDGGDQMGCHNLAAAYLAGSAVSRDGKRAVALYSKACQADVFASCLSLAMVLQMGLPGVPADPSAAKVAMKKACVGGMAAACVQLGAM